MKKSIILLSILSSLAFSDVFDNADVDLKTNITGTVATAKTIENSKDLNEISINYLIGRIKLPEIKLYSDINILSEKRINFNQIRINDLVANMDLRYESPELYKNLSVITTGKFAIGPEREDGIINFEDDSVQGDIDISFGTKYQALDFFSFSNSLKYYSNKLKPAKLTLDNRFIYDNYNDLKSETKLELGGYLSLTAKSTKVEEFKNGINNFYYNINNETEYTQNENMKYKFYTDLKGVVINLDDLSKLEKEKTTEKNSEESEEVEETSTGTAETTDESTNEQPSNEIAVNSENEENKLERSATQSINIFKIGFESRLNNLYKNLYVNTNASYNIVANNSTIKDEKIIKKLTELKVSGIGTENKVTHKINLDTTVGYKYEINEIANFDAYTKLGYEYSSNNYSQVGLNYGIDFSITPIDKLTINFGGNVPVSFVFDKNQNNKYDFKFSQVGIGGKVELKYKW